MFAVYVRQKYVAQDQLRVRDERNEMFVCALAQTDYMHRTGRTARAGASGKVTSLVGKRDETIAYQLHTQISSGGSLDAVAKNKFELDHRRKVEHRKNTEAAKKRAFKESRRCVCFPR